jgi:hypothetical protein
MSSIPGSVRGADYSAIPGKVSRWQAQYHSCTRSLLLSSVCVHDRCFGPLIMDEKSEGCGQHLASNLQDGFTSPVICMPMKIIWQSGGCQRDKSDVGSEPFNNNLINDIISAEILDLTKAFISSTYRFESASTVFSINSIVITKDFTRCLSQPSLHTTSPVSQMVHNFITTLSVISLLLTSRPRFSSGILASTRRHPPTFVQSIKSDKDAVVFNLSLLRVIATSSAWQAVWSWSPMVRSTRAMSKV